MPETVDLEAEACGDIGDARGVRAAHLRGKADELPDGHLERGRKLGFEPDPGQHRLAARPRLVRMTKVKAMPADLEG